MSKPKTASYAVLRAFPHEGTWYTRDNQHAVADLPPAVIGEHIVAGSIRLDDAEEAVAPAAAPPKDTPAGKDK